MCELMQIHHSVVKNQSFAGRVREQETHPENIKRIIPIPPQIKETQEKFHVRKRCPTDQGSIHV